MSRIQADSFWDGKTGGGVRCSSVGDDANRYLDPSAQSMEGNGGRSIASLLPGSYGLRGVVIPRSTAFGGSRGFDPQKPRLVNIDPDIKGQSCVVDLSQITKEKMEEAFLEAAQNPIAQTDIRLLAAQTFHNLAIGYEPVGMGPSGGPRPLERRAPLGSGLGTYVVPRAGLGGGQVLEEDLLPQTKSAELLSPSVQPRGAILPPGMPQTTLRPFRLNENPDNMEVTTGLRPPPPQEVDEDGNVYDIEPPTPPRPQFRDQTKREPRKVKLQGPTPQPKPVPRPQPSNNAVAPPETRVTFEMEGWGTFEATYHEVIKNDELLILVYDTRFKGGMKFFPQASKNVIAVKVEGSDTIYFVNCYGNKFEHAGYEYCILVVDQENTQENLNADKIADDTCTF